MSNIKEPSSWYPADDGLEHRGRFQARPSIIKAIKSTFCVVYTDCEQILRIVPDTGLKRCSKCYSKTPRGKK